MLRKQKERQNYTINHQFPWSFFYTTALPLAVCLKDYFLTKWNSIGMYTFAWLGKTWWHTYKNCIKAGFANIYLHVLNAYFVYVIHNKMPPTKPFNSHLFLNTKPCNFNRLHNISYIILQKKKKPTISEPTRCLSKSGMLFCILD